jgi:pilus assembly protein Flp/PilA
MLRIYVAASNLKHSLAHAVSKKLEALRADTSGVTAIEYGLIAGFISVAVIGALTLIGGSLTTLFTSIQTALGTASKAGGA